ncbi:Cuticular protein 72Ec [Carabus blaptoides fortunei]
MFSVNIQAHTTPAIMHFLIPVLAVLAVVTAKPVDEPAPFVATDNRDVDGSYTFSYTSEDSSKTEVRHADGTIVGGYQYIDADGILQKVQYQAGEDGVQILASNLPVGSTDPVQDTPEVLQAKDEHFHEVQRALQLIAKAEALEAAYRKLHPELDLA